MRLSQDSFSNSCTTQTDTITARNSQRKESTTRDILFPRSLKIKMRKKNAPQRHVERVHNFLIAVKRTENLLLLLISSFPYIEVYIMSLGWFLLELYHEHAPPIEILMEKNKSVGRCDCQLKMWYTIQHSDMWIQIHNGLYLTYGTIRLFTWKESGRTVMGYVHWTRSGHPSWSACGGIVALLFFSNIIFLRLFCVVRDTTNSFSPFYFLIFGSGENWMKRRRSMSTISWGFLRWGLWSFEDLIRPVSLLSTFEK